MCPKNPSLVPGRIQTSRNCPPIARTDTVGCGIQVWFGAFRTTARASTTISALPEAAVPKATVQPAACSSSAKGMAERIWPSCPKIVVSWVTSGTRRASNHRGISANTATNTMASPVPTRTLAPMATGISVANASTTCPATRSNPLTTSISLDPNRSTSRPAGIWADT